MKRYTISTPPTYDLHWLKEQARARYGAADVNELRTGELAIYFPVDQSNGSDLLLELVNEYDGTQTSDRARRSRAREALRGRLAEDSIASLRASIESANSVPDLKVSLLAILDLIEALKT